MDLGNLGFDFDAVLAAIEDRFLSRSPGDRPERQVVHALMDAHMMLHGLPVFCEEDGVLVPAPRCSVRPCLLAGLAFAAFELRWYKINASDLEEATLFEHVATCPALVAEVRQGFGDMATRRREAVFSRPLQVPRSRRPPTALAQAVAQHLRSGALSYPAIGSLMGSTSGCAEKRCAAPDIRSVMPYSEVEDRGAA